MTFAPNQPGTRTCPRITRHSISKVLGEGDRRKFYQGLIQASVALLHFGNENLGGAKKVYLSSRKYLEAYAPSYEGLDVEEFLKNLDWCFAELVENQDKYPAGVALRDERIPKLKIPGD
ncbi:MAG: DUF309 domain-containing protein [Planctomycetota bacterium]|nr:DUF309 domain-containing protein [Planctomycetota bacterium]